MKTFILLALAVTVLYLPGCKKDSSDDPVVQPDPTVDGRIKEERRVIDHGANGVEFLYDREYTYNPNGTLAYYTSKNQTGNAVYIMAYQQTGDTLLELMYPPDFITATDTNVYTLNTLGFVIKRQTSGFNYTYDVEGHLIEVYDTTMAYHIINNYTNGNLLTAVLTQPIGTTNSTYTYFNNKPNYAHRGQPYFGKASTSLIKTLTQGNNAPTTYQYQFDNKGRVTELTNHSSSTSDIGIHTFTYFN